MAATDLDFLGRATYCLDRDGTYRLNVQMQYVQEEHWNTHQHGVKSPVRGDMPKYDAPDRS